MIGIAELHDVAESRAFAGWITAEYLITFLEQVPD